MEQSDRIFGVPCTASAVQSFSGIAASRLFSNPFASVTTTATTVVSFSSMFGQSPVFATNANTTTSSASLPFASFNFSAPSFPPQNSTLFFTSSEEPSYRSIAKSNDPEVPLLFGKPVRDELRKEESEEEVKTAQPSRLEPKRRWNAKPGNLLNLIFAEMYGQCLTLLGFHTTSVVT